jgi:hypothetical protein
VRKHTGFQNDAKKAKRRAGKGGSRYGVKSTVGLQAAVRD